MRISKNNIIFLLLMITTYILLNFFLGLRDITLIQMTAVQLILIVIASSPIGETVLRFIYGMKIIKTSKDKEYLMPLFDEVYDSIRTQEKYNNDKIQLYIDKSMTVNAYALGTRTIAITRGAKKL